MTQDPEAFRCKRKKRGMGAVRLWTSFFSSFFAATILLTCIEVNPVSFLSPSPAEVGLQVLEKTVCLNTDSE